MNEQIFTGLYQDLAQIVASQHQFYFFVAKNFGLLFLIFFLLLFLTILFGKKINQCSFFKKRWSYKLLLAIEFLILAYVCYYPNARFYTEQDFDIDSKQLLVIYNQKHSNQQVVIEDIYQFKKYLFNNHNVNNKNVEIPLNHFYVPSNN